jgi:ferredoxin-nitrate reductase
MLCFLQHNWGEKTGCFTNVDRTVHISHKAIEPPGEAKSDFEIFVEFAKRMDFRDKDGQPLINWQNTEDGFNAWKKMSKGCPCDYSGLSYEKLTGGSGIQWPCNENNPQGKERLFDDGFFFTDMDYCEDFGHDLETGAALTKDQYRTLNPAGRAIFKAADYIPALEETNDEYPLQLSTGRQTHQFHTRTKTGRSKDLNRGSGDAFAEISKADAEELDVKDGETVLIKSRRGSLQIPLSIGKIAKGQIFIPFHYGYFDMNDARSRAANELTQGESSRSLS